MLKITTDHCYAIFIDGLRIPSPSFADTSFTLLALHPSYSNWFVILRFLLINQLNEFPHHLFNPNAFLSNYIF